MTEPKSHNANLTKRPANDLPAFRAPSAEDRRVGFGQGWVLVAGMLCLATVFMGIVWTTAPRAWRGWLVGAGVLFVTFFLLAPIAAVFTRRLYKKQRKSNRSS
ncbi:MAG: hypothetical protein ACKVS6_11430 [Planctomycetota bacterium]